MWDHDEKRADEVRQWIRDASQRVRPYSTGATYINFQTADEGEARVRAAYGRNFRRLLEIKKKYDPTNLFRMNHNLRPE